MRITWLLVVITATSTFESSASLSWCPVGIHIHHVLKDYSTQNVGNVLCSESCIILKNFTYERTGHAYVAGFCVPAAKCDSTPSCTDIASYMPDLNRARIDHCISSCCNDEASCRKAMKLDDTYQNPSCKRNEPYAKALDPGRVCRKQCRNQRDCRGKLKRCECDDWCGFSCFNPNYVCQLPPVRKPMVVEYSGGNRHIIQYSCAEGYFLSGNSQRKCRTDRKFSGRSPTCKAGCKPPEPVVANSIAVTMEQGYGVGGEVNFVCQYGYLMSGTAKVICNNDGSWSAQNFKCERNACGTPPQINRNNVSPDPPVVYLDESGYLVARYRCADGFKLKSGAYNTFCNAPSATWSPSTLICESELQCAAIESTFSLTVKLSADKQSASFSCRDGWRLSGKKRLACRNGRWSGQVPTCQVEYCTYNESQLHPGVSRAFYGFPQQRYRLGEQLILQCNGAELARLTCLPGFVWSDDIRRLTCADEACTIDRSMLQDNVELDESGSKYAVGEKATFRCQQRELKTIECLGKSRWSDDYTKLKCEKDRCPEIEKNDEITVWYWGNRRVGYPVSVTCTGSQQQILWCRSDLRWHPPPPICSAGSCKLPAISQRLVVTEPANHGGEFASGTTITVGCKNPRMILQGLSELTCVSGKWNGKPPVCGCREFDNKPARLSVTIWNQGSTAQFRCDVGYDLIGSFSAECLDSGSWSHPTPFCREIGCEIDAFLLPPGVQVLNHYTDASDGLLKFPRGETVQLTCNGKAVEKITCGKRSIWSKDYMKIPCQQDIKPTKVPDKSPTKKPDRLTTKKPIGLSTNAPGKSCNCVCGNAGDTFDVDQIVLQRVVGGTEAIPHAWPWQVVILSKMKTGNETITNVQGGGTLISENWMLTAAHVFEFQRRRRAEWHKRFVFGLGTHDIDSLATLNGNEEFYAASFITVHEKFDIVNMANDIALVRVGEYFDIKRNKEIESSRSGKVTFNRYIRPICLPCMDSCTSIKFRKADFNLKSCNKKAKSYKSSSRSNKEVLGRPVVTGYGHTEKRNVTSDDPIVTATILQQAPLTIRNPKKCTRSLKQMRDNNIRVPDNIDGAICASSGKPTDACRGDSGGPLSRNVKAKSGACWLQVGIVSWGIGCAVRVNGVAYPGYYVDVAHYMPWIIDVASRTP